MIYLNPRHQRSPKNQIINNVYPDWLENDGVINSLITPPWEGEVDSVGLNLAYHARSGNKFISPICYNFLNDDGELTASGKTSLAKLLAAMYNSKWEKLWNTYTIEYSPLTTNQSTETKVFTSHRGESTLNTRTPNLTTAASTQGTDTRSPQLNYSTTATTDSLRTPNVSTETSISTTATEATNLSTTATVSEKVVFADDTTNTSNYGKNISVAHTGADTISHAVFGFNSSNGAPASDDEKTSAYDTSTAHSGTDTTIVESDKSANTDTANQSTESTETTNSRAESTTSRETGTESNSSSSTTTTSETGTDQTTSNVSTSTSLVGTDVNQNQLTENANTSETITISGTNESPSKLLAYDRELWMVLYFDIVFRDIDEFLTLAVYSSSDINTYNY